MRIAKTLPKRTRVSLNSVGFGEEEIQGAIQVLRSGRVTMGERCREFEAAFAAYIGQPHAIFVNSGSSANLLALFALANPWLRSKTPPQLEPGSEVIVPAVTWSTTIWPIVQVGCVPVLVDSDPETLQMDVTAIERAVSPQTRAICVAHVLGNAVRIEPLKRLVESRGLWLIEDTCEALGVRHDGRLTGTFGQIGTYSFFFSHHITTIEGGMVVTDDDELADLIRCLRAHGWTRDLSNREQVESRYPEIDPRFLFVNTGFNVRPTEINAVFGIQQLARLDDFNARRRTIAASWTSRLDPIIRTGHLTPMRSTPDTVTAHFGYPVLCRDRRDRDGLRTHLERSGIETRPIICGNIARQPVFQRIRHRIPQPLTGADQIMDRGLLWGAHPNLTEADIDYVADVVMEFFAQ